MLILPYVLVIIKHLKLLTYHILSRSEVWIRSIVYRQRFVFKLRGADCGMSYLLFFLIIPDQGYVPAIRPV